MLQITPHETARAYELGGMVAEAERCGEPTPFDAHERGDLWRAVMGSARMEKYLHGSSQQLGVAFRRGYDAWG